MFDISKVKGLLFDYGGTIDSNGMHWAEVLWMAYEAMQIPVGKETFREAYIHGERTLGKNPLVQPQHTFRDMLLLKVDLQIEWLKAGQFISGCYTTQTVKTAVADWCYAYARRAIDATRPVISTLAERYPMVLVSNFYGNIESVLKDFALDGFFNSVVESAVVGIRKPDPAIFALGIEALGLPATQTVVIGDSHDKDIIPATTLGCQTIWLKSIGWSAYKGDETADAVIANFIELKELFRL